MLKHIAKFLSTFFVLFRSFCDQTARTSVYMTVLSLRLQELLLAYCRHLLLQQSAQLVAIDVGGGAARLLEKEKSIRRKLRLQLGDSCGGGGDSVSAVLRLFEMVGLAATDLRR